ncbi:hypothetical protein BH24ACT1_BH24ACT1_12540 [soil metagenome]
MVIPTIPGVRCRERCRIAFGDLLATGTEPVAARARVVAGVAVAVARDLGVELAPLALLSRWGSPVMIDVASADASPSLVATVYEALLDPAGRRSSGAFYTPPNVAAAVVGWALEGRASSRPVVCDPSAGGGAFLLAAADVLVAGGQSREQVVSECLVGADVDPVAVAVTEAVLGLWCGGVAVPRIVVGDVLALEPSDWPERPDVVVGNPPFLNQLGRRTMRPRGDVVALRRRLGASVTPYADTAVLFLVMATNLVGPSGTVALILPESFLATRDARAARSTVLSEARLEALWVPSVPVFPAAAVRICVPVLHRGGLRQGRLRLWREMPPRLAAEIDVDADVLSDAPTWSRLLSAGSDTPECTLDGEGFLGQWCAVSADFRQHYYGIASFLVDDPTGELDDEAFPPLVTVGLVDPAVCRWGQRPTRHHRRRWERPRVELARLESESGLGSWAASRLVPKVVVATQTRVVEAAVDIDGTWLPSTPLISVVAPPERLWHIGAALLAPPVTAWALHHWEGTALSAGGLKLSAAQVRSLPAPRPGADWDEAAEHVRQATEATDEDERRHWLLAAGNASSRAYGVTDPAVVSWWQARLPRR